MSVDGIPLGHACEFLNGKAPVISDNGEFVVYGSNGPIGRSKDFNHENAIILGRVGAYCGSVKICNDKFWASDNTIVVKSQGTCDLIYLYYRLLSTQLRTFAGGAAQPLLTHTILRGVRIRFEPDKTKQIKIGTILKCYDDLIENNRRRIQLLEQSARLLYKEWFVRLRFPGHEHVKIKDGVPEGWKNFSLAELSDSISYGYTASGERNSVGPKLLRITDIVPDVIDWAAVPFCRISEKDSQKFLLREGDVVVARTGATVGYAKRIGQLEHNAVFASYLVRFRFSEKIDNTIAGIFMESQDYKAFVRNNAGGAAQPNANATVLSAVKLLAPPNSVQKNFRELVEPINHQKDILQKQNHSIAKARDLLLPRLMNGEIEV